MDEDIAIVEQQQAVIDREATAAHRGNLGRRPR